MLCQEESRTFQILFIQNTKESWNPWIYSRNSCDNSLSHGNRLNDGHTLYSACNRRRERGYGREILRPSPSIIKVFFSWFDNYPSEIKGIV